jgi:hypothetical protein
MVYNIYCQHKFKSVQTSIVFFLLSVEFFFVIPAEKSCKELATLLRRGKGEILGGKFKTFFPIHVPYSFLGCGNRGGGGIILSLDICTCVFCMVYIILLGVHTHEG